MTKIILIIIFLLLLVIPFYYLKYNSIKEFWAEASIAMLDIWLIISITCFSIIIFQSGGELDSFKALLWADFEFLIFYFSMFPVFSVGILYESSEEWVDTIRVSYIKNFYSFIPFLYIFLKFMDFF